MVIIMQTRAGIGVGRGCMNVRTQLDHIQVVSKQISRPQTNYY